jgi:hypothetical protein
MSSFIIFCLLSNVGRILRLLRRIRNVSSERIRAIWSNYCVPLAHFMHRMVCLVAFVSGNHGWQMNDVRGSVARPAVKNFSISGARKRVKEDTGTKR